MTISYRKLVMPEDMNPANRLFGGRLLQFVDEATALYAMCQLRTRNVVTLKFSESTFKEPVKVGDYLEFICSTKALGRTSITVYCSVQTKDIEPGEPRREVFAAEVVFVHIGADGKSKPHGITETRHADLHHL